MYTKILLAVAVAAVVIFSETDAAEAIQVAKAGSSVDIEIAQGAKALSRTTKEGKSILNFSGANAGVFVDEKGNKLESKNYELKKDGTLVIKKVTAADAGSYAKEPNPAVGNVAGNVLVLQVE